MSSSKQVQEDHLKDLMDKVSVDSKDSMINSDKVVAKVKVKVKEVAHLEMCSKNSKSSLVEVKEEEVLERVLNMLQKAKILS